METGPLSISSTSHVLPGVSVHDVGAVCVVSSVVVTTSVMDIGIFIAVDAGARLGNIVVNMRQGDDTLRLWERQVVFKFCPL